jgi:hypothetical protein
MFDCELNDFFFGQGFREAPLLDIIAANQDVGFQETFYSVDRCHC